MRQRSSNFSLPPPSPCMPARLYLLLALLLPSRLVGFLLAAFSPPSPLPPFSEKPCSALPPLYGNATWFVAVVRLVGSLFGHETLAYLPYSSYGLRTYYYYPYAADIITVFIYLLLPVSAAFLWPLYMAVLPDDLAPAPPFSCSVAVAFTGHAGSSPTTPDCLLQRPQHTPAFAVSSFNAPSATATRPASLPPAAAAAFYFSAACTAFLTARIRIASGIRIVPALCRLLWCSASLCHCVLPLVICPTWRTRQVFEPALPSYNLLCFPGPSNMIGSFCGLVRSFTGFSSVLVRSGSLVLVLWIAGFYACVRLGPAPAPCLASPYYIAFMAALTPAWQPSAFYSIVTLSSLAAGVPLTPALALSLPQHTLPLPHNWLPTLP